MMKNNDTVNGLSEIKPGQVPPELRSLFDPGMPTILRCYAVLGGGNAGRIFVDDLEQPRIAYVWEQDDGTLYQGGRKDAQTLLQMVELLRQHGTVALDFRDGDPQVEMFPPNPEAGAECVELTRPAWGSDLSPYLDLPEGFEVHRMGRELIEKSPRLDETLFRYSDLEIYLKTGMDVCILHGDEYVCEAGADMDVGGVREVGVVVERPYRKGLGFGTLVTAHLLRWCDELGVSTYWDCVRLNIGSLKIARKLGFMNERSYKILAWFLPNREVGIQ
jgi:RimJ/RimL family protein N-acetyltransferase